jgi:uncharacterized protein Usg
MIILDRKVIVTLDVFYYIPSHTHLINEFVWQTEDVYPKFYRAHKFLNYWKSNIDAVIKEVIVVYNHRGEWRNAKFEGLID